MEVSKQHYPEMRLGAASMSQSVCRSEKQCNLDSLTKIQLCDGHSLRLNTKGGPTQLNARDIYLDSDKEMRKKH